MISGGSLPSNVSLSYGLDADKPETPKASQMYLSLDTQNFYVCFVEGAWFDLSEMVSKDAILNEVSFPDLLMADAMNGTVSSAAYDIQFIKDTDQTDILIQNDSQEYHELVQTWGKLKQFTVLKPSYCGQIRAVLRGKASSGSYPVNFRIYRNDEVVAESGLITSTAEAERCNVVIDIEVGDTISAWMWNTADNWHGFIEDLQLWGTLETPSYTGSMFSLTG